MNIQSFFTTIAKKLQSGLPVVHMVCRLQLLVVSLLIYPKLPLWSVFKIIFCSSAKTNVPNTARLLSEEDL